jgi:hypothetical protein
MVGGSGTELSYGIARSRIDLSYVLMKYSTVISLAVPILQNVKNHVHHPLKGVVDASFLGHSKNKNTIVIFSGKR